MNEELKIIISAEIDKLKSELQKGQKEVQKFTKSTSGTMSKFGASMKKVGSAVAAGLKVAIGAIAAAMTALIALSASTKQYREEQARLNSAFQAAGSSAAQAAKSYNNLYRFLGDSGKASEAAAHLAKLTTSEQSLAEWTTACQGIYATFGDSLPIEGLTEAANETARVGKVTGTLADALNWAGVNEDAFNESLAKCTSLSERETLIRRTLNGLYGEAAQLYEENNKAIIKQNEANARLQATLGRLGEAVTPLVTALTELANVVLAAITPAIEAIMPILTAFIDKLVLGVQYIAAFFGAFNKNSTKEVASGINTAAKGTGALTSGFQQATEAAKALKKQTAGFDELNIMQSEQAASSAASGGGAGLSDMGTVTIDTSGFENKMNDINGKMEALREKVKAAFDLFKSSIMALSPIWTAFVDALDISEIIGKLGAGFETAKEKLIVFAQGLDFSKYIPTLTAFAESAGNYANTIATSVLDIVGTVTSDIFDAVAPVAQTFINDTIPTLISMLGGFYDICSTIVEELTKLILQAWKTIAPLFDLVGQMLVDLQNILNEFWNVHGAPIVSAIQEGVRTLGEVISNIWGTVVHPILSKVIEVVEEVWQNHLKPVVEKIMDIVGKLVEVIMAFWNNVLAPIVNWIVNTFLPPIVKVVETILDVVGKVVGGIIDFIGGLLDALGGVLDFLLGVFTGDWELAWTGIKEFVGGIWDAICAIVKTAVDLIVGIVQIAWEALKAIFEVLWNAIKGIVEVVWNAISGIVEAAVNFISNLIETAWNAIKDFFQFIWDGIKSIFETAVNAISSFLENAWNAIKGVIETVWNAIKNFFSMIWDGITSIVSSAINAIKNVIETVMDVIKNIISTVLNTIKNLWDDMCTAVKNIVNGLSTALSTIVTNIKNMFLNGFNAVKNGVVNIFNNIKSSVTSIMNGLKNAIKAPINAIIGFINGLMDGVESGINGMIRALNRLSFDVPDWVPGIGGETFGFNISTISIPNIPKLATGGIVTDSILANIGEAGKEAVLPLENNTEWMDILAEKIAARNGAPSKIVLQVGEKELGWATINSINQITKQTGGLQLAL